MKKRIGVLGGSFDPVHDGHVSIARSFLKCNLIHRLLIIPASSPPHKPGELSASFSHRFEMLKLAFKNDEKVTVSEIENRLPDPSYTLRTIHSLQQTHPDTLFYLCMGGDSLAGFDTWYEYREILKRVFLLVAERPDEDPLQVKEAIREKAVFTEHQPLRISSSSIRKKRMKHPELLETQRVPGSVAKYISKHHLYLSQDI
ncbi:MAG: nicotinate (nicotinamide) nucleotide adenylyltransferase [Balneolaceae bacterium]